MGGLEGREAKADVSPQREAYNNQPPASASQGVWPGRGAKPPLGVLEDCRPRGFEGQTRQTWSAASGKEGLPPAAACTGPLPLSYPARTRTWIEGTKIPSVTSYTTG